MQAYRLEPLVNSLYSQVKPVKLDSAGSKPSKDMVDLAQGPREEEKTPPTTSKGWSLNSWFSSSSKKAEPPPQTKIPETVSVCMCVWKRDDRQTDRTDRQINRQTDRQTDRWADGQIDRQTDGRMDRWADGWDKWTYRNRLTDLTDREIMHVRACVCVRERERNRVHEQNVPVCLCE